MIRASCSSTVLFSSGKAGRLIMTEAAAFSSAAQKDSFTELGVERFKVVAAFDKDTCDICGAMDGQVFKMPEYQVGLTAPPFHPWCRCCTCPYYADMEKLGERWTRNPDGTTAKVPPDMTFDKWRQRFVKEDVKSSLIEIFRSMGDYIHPDGSFDLEAAKADYRKFLQTLPEKNRIYLEQAMAGVEYEQRRLKRSPFGYYDKDDAILYDPTHRDFKRYDFTVAATHELAHRIDHTMFIHSWENEAFSNAIIKARKIMDSNPQKFLDFAKSDTSGFMSDIFSAICEDDYRFDMYHEKCYWQVPGNKEKEIFANLFSMESLGDKEDLMLLKDNFPHILDAYNAFFV